MASIRIGDSDFTGRKDIQVEEEPEVDPEVVKKIIAEFKPVFIPEKRIPEILADFDCVVVNDFGDDYHMSEEERAKANKFYEVFKEYRGKRKKYRKIEEYVDVVRMALKVLDTVAEENGVFPPEEFKKKFLKDQIYVNGLKIPKFTGREKKRINWDYIADFIMSDEPSENLIPKKSEHIMSEEEVDEKAELMFDEGEIEEILTPLSEDEELDQTEEHDIDDYEEMKTTTVFPLSRKEMRTLSKKIPEIVYGIKEYRRGMKSVNTLSRFVYDLSSSDFSDLERYDRTHQYVVKGEVPEFKGDIMDDDAYNRYMAELKEYEETQIRELYDGKFKTREEIEAIEIKKTLDKFGYNLRNLYDNKEKEKKLKKLQKRDKRKEKELKKRLVQIQTRNKRRMGEDVDSKKKNKKGNKKKKSTKGKKSKKDHHEEVDENGMTVKEYENELKEASDEFLLAAMGRADGDFDDYKDEVMEFTWGK